MRHRLPTPCCATDGRSRTLPGTTAQARAVAVFKALADSTRLQIFSLIAARPEPICVCDIVSRFELRQPFFSTEGLRSGDKDDLVSFLFGPGDDFLCGFCCAARRNSSQSGDKKKCCEPTGL